MSGIDTSFDFDLYGYKTEKANELECDANTFAMITTFEIMREDNFSSVVNQ